MRVLPDPRLTTRTERSTAPWGGRRAAEFGVSAFVLFTLMLGLWAMANPLMAGRDEPSHTARAAAAVRGDFFGTPVEGSTTARTVTVPALFEQAFGLTCFTASPHTTALCQPALTYVPAEATVEITATPSGPAYYLLTGLPSLVVDSTKVFHLMRAVSLMACAIFLAFALTAAINRARPLTIAGFVFAMTPTMFFYGSVVNPIGLGLAASIALWSSGLTVVDRLRRDEPLGWFGGGLVASASVVALVLPYGPLWVLFVAAAAVLRSRTERAVLVRMFEGGRRKVAMAVVLVAAVLGAAGTSRSTESLWSRDAVVGPGEVPSFLHFITFQTQSLIVGTIAKFSWGEFEIPIWLVIVYLGVVAAMVLWLFIVGRRRDRFFLAGLGLAVFVGPAVIRAAGFQSGGAEWSAIDYLPLLIGIPVVLGLALRDPDPRYSDDRIVFGPRTFLGVWASLQFVAYTVNLHRQVKGANGSWFVTIPGEWPPPVNWYLLMILYAIALVGFTILVSRAVAREGFAARASEVSA